MSKEIFIKKVSVARKKLEEKGLVAFDGSGDLDIEGLFVLLSKLMDGTLILTRGSEER
jgi:hypothetical protein